MAELQEPLPFDSDDEPDGESDSESSQSNITSEDNSNETSTETLIYIESVRDTFGGNSFEYAAFLQLLRDFKAHRLDPREVISRVKVLFKEHQKLLVGFNTFLPPGYKISLPGQVDLGIQDAINFVNKVKAQFPDDDGRFRAFLDIVRECLNGKNFDMAYQELAILFHDRPDLLLDFVRFSPDSSKSMATKTIHKTKPMDSLVLFFFVSSFVAFLMWTTYGFYFPRR